MNEQANKGPNRALTARRHRFAELVAAGKSQSNAYREAFGHPEWADPLAAEKGCKLARVPRVAELINSLRSRSVGKSLLTLNDRLGILAEIAQAKKSKPHEKSRAIEVYSKISGDQAPERHELSAPGGGPIQVVAALNVTRVSVRDRIKLLRAARERDKAADEASKVQP